MEDASPKEISSGETTPSVPSTQGDAEVDAEVNAELEAKARRENNRQSCSEGCDVKVIDDAAKQDLALSIEAALLTTDRPLTIAKLSEVFDNVGVKIIKEIVEALNVIYIESGRSFSIEKVAGGLQILTLPKYANVLASLHKTRQSNKLTPAGLETLAIIAYKQPILRAEIEAIRGVASGEMVRSLMERRLIKITGRAEELGRPMLYGTTKQFLEVFGLSSLKDLPKAEEFRPTQKIIPDKPTLKIHIDQDGQATEQGSDPQDLSSAKESSTSENTQTTDAIAAENNEEGVEVSTQATEVPVKTDTNTNDNNTSTDDNNADTDPDHASSIAEEQTNASQQTEQGDRDEA